MVEGIDLKLHIKQKFQFFFKSHVNEIAVISWLE